MKVVLATKNKGKLKEFLFLTKNCDIELTSLPQGSISPEESGISFYENALIKAESALLETGITALADDSGLEVDFLNGQPGIYSSRFSSEATDEANNQKLLDLMEGVKEEDRTARFKCCLVLLKKNKKPVVSEGSLEGRISIKRSGENGFGYDPIFFIPEIGLHLAEMNKKEKSAISHRSNAWKELIKKLGYSFEH